MKGVWKRERARARACVRVLKGREAGNVWQCVYESVSTCV